MVKLQKLNLQIPVNAQLKCNFGAKQKSMHVHFIAIGGSAMHNLAIALHNKGFHVTGSDDEIFEPAKSRLAALNLLPEKEGWFPEKINSSLDSVILGMHAKGDNPELLKAKAEGIRIFSYPEYLYEQSKYKKRVVIGGSHGKTTITAMILHVMQYHKMDCDYMVGAQLEGFNVMVKLSEQAPVMVIEGDEYLTSPLDPRPKFHLYKPDIAILSGIAWDHINVFPTFENYVSQFTTFIQQISPGGSLIYCTEDEQLRKICPGSRDNISIIPYGIPPHYIDHEITFLKEGDVPLMIFGKHNLMNLNGARLVCNQLGIPDDKFYEAIRGFKGASKRLEIVASGDHSVVFKDFAHAPSKVSATLSAVRAQFPERKLIACLELHTYSSLSKEFLGLYTGTLNDADIPIVYYNPHALMLKRLPDLHPDQIFEGFGNRKIEIFNDSAKLKSRLNQEPKKNVVFLMMSSGNYDGLDLKTLLEP